MKRAGRASYGAKRPFKKPRKASYRQPVRAYGGSRVPLASRGYRLNSVEKKVNDIAAASYAINTTGSFTLLAFPVVGADFTQRIGRKVMLRNLYIRGFLSTDPASTAGTSNGIVTQCCRMIIFADLQPNGAAPAVTDLLNTATSVSHLNLNNRDRFKVYCDKQWVFGPYLHITTATQAEAMNSQQVYSLKKYKKINQEMVFNAVNGGTIADVTSGALYMFWIGSTVAGGADGVANVTTRIRYTDV